MHTVDFWRSFGSESYMVDTALQIVARSGSVITGDVDACHALTRGLAGCLIFEDRGANRQHHRAVGVAVVSANSATRWSSRRAMLIRVRASLQCMVESASEGIDRRIIERARRECRATIHAAEVGFILGIAS
jgi:hypothetical protein